AALPDPGEKAPEAKEGAKSLPEGAAVRLGSPRFWAGGGINASGYSLTFTPDSKHVAMVGGDGGVHIWDAATGQEAANLGARDQANPVRPTAAVSVVFSRDGKLAAISGTGGLLHLWDVKEKKDLGELAKEGNAAPVTCEFAPDGKTLAGASWA